MLDQREEAALAVGGGSERSELGEQRGLLVVDETACAEELDGRADGRVVREPHAEAERRLEEALRDLASSPRHEAHGDDALRRHGRDRELFLAVHRP